MIGTRSGRLIRKAKRIRMILLDVDGVMTDGGIYYSADGVELKRFNAQDGYGIQMAREQGVRIGIISGRSTPIVTTRAQTLHIEDVYQAVDDKLAAMREIQQRHGLTESEIAYIGDDLFDVPLLRAVGLSATPSNGRGELRRIVDYVTAARGGDGAVRELIELILHARNGAVRERSRPSRMRTRKTKK